MMEKISIKYDAEFAGRLYGSYLKSNRVRLGFTPKQVSLGLCSGSELSEIENGKKNAGWLCRERLLLRAGVDREECESYLNCEDFAEWKIQEDIVKALGKNDVEEMAALLEKYADTYQVEKWEWDGREDASLGEEKNRKGEKNIEKENVVGRLRRQFYLGLLGMCKKLCAAPMEELAEIFWEAACLTIPTLREGFMHGLVLCAEEIHLVLEYARCLPFYDALRWCREIQKYLQGARMEDGEKALNYPKVVFVLCQYLSEQKNAGLKTYEEIRELCGEGIELLRKTKKIYYLLKLLEMKKWAIEQIQKLSYQTEEINEEDEEQEREKKEKAAFFQKEIAEIEEWQECFREIYRRFGNLEQRNTDAWLYQRQEVFCIGDIVRIRRKMLKMTQRKLCEGTCSEDTLKRLERKKKSTQPPILWDLCQRLGLSPECERTELVTADPRARELEKEIRYAANNGKFKGNLARIEELKTLIDMSNKSNQQWVLRTEGMARYRQGEIGREEYEDWLKKALECTLPLSVLELGDGEECYLTNAEMACIYHLARLWREEEKRDYPAAYEQMRLVFRVEREVEERKEEENHIRRYELYTVYQTRILCELGKHEDARQYAKKVLQICWKTGRANILDGALYNWMRNQDSVTGETEPEGSNYDWKKDLRYCLTLSRFCKNIVQRRFYEELLQSLDKNEKTNEPLEE